MFEKFKKIFNISNSKEIEYKTSISTTASFSGMVRSYNNQNGILTPVLNKISIDVSLLDFIVSESTDFGTFKNKADYPSFNKVLGLSANIDQNKFLFLQDVVMKMLSDGDVAILPSVTDVDPIIHENFKIYEMRVGSVVEYKTDTVIVSYYNNLTGDMEEREFPKRIVAIVQNPLYETLNASSSTIQRLLRKMTIQDTLDNDTVSGKLDIFIQLPYTTKNEKRKGDAEERKSNLESQLQNSKYGIAYIDANERIVQLNRPADNNISEAIENIKRELYTQLGVTPAILAGTASKEEMQNYLKRTVYPIANSISFELSRKYISDISLDSGILVMAIHNPLKFMTLEDFILASDSLSRNEIVKPNELRSVMGLPRDNDAKSDKLINRNLNHNENQNNNQNENIKDKEN